MTKYGEINNWDVSKVTDMRWMFHGAESFNQPLNNWNVSKVTRMSYMFAYARSFNQLLHFTGAERTSGEEQRSDERRKTA